MPYPKQKGCCVRLDRHPGTGVRGLPKKEGLKGWGKPGEEEPIAILDENDPNYDEGELEEESTIQEGVTLPDRK
jgi:hypothetical protein